jgi:hypothetical protein
MINTLQKENTISAVGALDVVGALGFVPKVNSADYPIYTTSITSDTYAQSIISGEALSFYFKSKYNITVTEKQITNALQNTYPELFLMV